jgi:hypothetical protein
VRARQEVRRLITKHDPRAEEAVRPDVDVHGDGERTDVPEYRDGALADAPPTHGTRIASSAIRSKTLTG